MNLKARHEQAIAIQDGVSNLSGIALMIAAACREVREEGRFPATDSAVRLMVHQLAFVCGMSGIDHNSPLYSRLIRDCRAGAVDANGAPWISYTV